MKKPNRKSDCAVSFRITREVRDMLEYICEKEGVTKTKIFVESVVDKYREIVIAENDEEEEDEYAPDPSDFI